jgi:filamentous hemagglutinin
MDKENYLGIDKWGNNWYATSLPNGQQIWVQIRKGEIINGGINSSSRLWSHSTGLIQ